MERTRRALRRRERSAGMDLRSRDDMMWSPNGWARGKLPPVKLPKSGARRHAAPAAPVHPDRRRVRPPRRLLPYRDRHHPLGHLRPARRGQSRRDRHLARARRHRRDLAGPLRVPGSEGQRRDSYQGRRPHLRRRRARVHRAGQVRGVRGVDRQWQFARPRRPGAADGRGHRLADRPGVRAAARSSAG